MFFSFFCCFGTFLNAEKLVFLGFAYHPWNVDLILPADSPSRAVANKRAIFGTAVGKSSSDIRIISDEIMNRWRALPQNVFIEANITCSGLFDEFSRGISLVR